MPSVKNLEMAAAISAYNNIEIKKSLFSTKAIYTPTQSAVKVNVLEYVPAEGERIERLLNMPVSKMGDELDQKGKPKTVGMGHYRLFSVSPISRTSQSRSLVSTKAARLQHLPNCSKP